MRPFPSRLQLPSGRIVRISEEKADRDAPVATDSLLFGDALDLLAHRIRLEDEARREPLSVEQLRLDDFHALRAIATRLGRLSEPLIRYPCRNCQREVEARPSSGLELGPFIDCELSDPELDGEFPFDKALTLADSEVEHSLRTVSFAPRKVDEVRPLWAALASPSWQFDAAIVSALGIASLGEETDPEKIAKLLEEAPEDITDEVLGYFDEAYYPPRLSAAIHCEGCGAVDYVDAPSEREFRRETSLIPCVDEPFLTLDAFETRVKLFADDIYRERGISQAVHLIVDADVPAVDDGGVPLLGSYMPGGTDPLTGIPEAPEVTIYYRSFLAMWNEEGPYDVDAEIAETIDHELEHHLHMIAGFDPLDDSERAAIDAEAIRIIGKSEVTRRARAAFVADLSEFFRRTWPLWLALLAFTVVASLFER